MIGPGGSEPRKKPGVAFWATVVLVVALVGYPLSLGPACWLSSGANAGSGFVSAAYHPMTWLIGSGNAGTALVWYSSLFSDHCWNWIGNPDDGWTWEPCDS